MITAIVSIVALNSGDDGGGGGSVAPATRSESAAAPPASGEEGCFRQYFDGVPADRVAPVEVGTNALDVIGADQPKTGTVGLRFTSNTANGSRTTPTPHAAATRTAS